MAAKRRYRKKQDNAAMGLIGILILIVLAHPAYLLLAILLLTLVVAAYVCFKIYEHRRLKASGIEDIDKMPGHMFEAYLGVLFKELGYKAIVTRASGDYGADLILQKDGRKIVVQAKRYTGNVGIKAIQEVHGSINYYNAHEGWVVTNQGFTEQAKNLARSNGITLIGRKELIRLSLEAKQTGKNAPTSVQIEPTDEPVV